MKHFLIVHLLVLVVLLGFATDIVAIPVDTLPQDNELSESSPDLNSPFSNDPAANKAQSKKITGNPKQKQFLLNSSLNQPVPSAKASENTDPATFKLEYEKEDTGLYWLNQSESDAPKSPQNIFQSGSPLLTPEMKKNLKEIWIETADFREALDIASKKSDSKDYMMQNPMSEMPLLEQENLENAANNNHLPASNSKKPDKMLVKELFEGIFDIIKNSLLIIVGVLLFGKATSFLVKKIIANKKKRKKRLSKRRRRKRRHTYA